MNLVASLDHFIESMNLIPANFVLCFIGAMLCITVMQLSGHHGELMNESKFGIFLRRFSLMLLAISLMWASSYSATKGWQPWPPHVLLVFVLDLVLAMRAIQIVVRCRQLHRMFGRNASVRFRRFG